MFPENRAQSHLDNAIVQNFMKKYKIQLEILFFRRKSAVLAIFKKFLLQKSFLLIMEHA